MSEWYERVQGATSNVAENSGEAWDAESLDMVIAFTDDERDEDIALALGRTLAAVWAIQHRLRTEGVDATRAHIARRRVVASEVGYDYVTTFPPGHFD